MKCACSQFASFGPFGCEHQRLAEAAEAVARKVAPKVGRPAPAAARQKPDLRQAFEQRPRDPPRLLVQIFGQVADRRLDLVMHRMTLAVGRPPERDDDQFEAGAFEPAAIPAR